MINIVVIVNFDSYYYSKLLHTVKQEIMKRLPKKCPLCGKNPTTHWQLPEYWWCRGCQLSWYKAYPKKIHYQASYYTATSAVASTLFSPLGRLFYSIRNRYAGEGFVNTWIDVGAGDGGYLLTVSAVKKIGVEISAAGRTFMSKLGIVAQTPQAFLCGRQVVADSISFWHVLEHLDEPWIYLTAAKRQLKSSGVVIIGVPNFESIERVVSGRYWFHLVPAYHLWHFTPLSMTRLLEKTGFRLQRIDYWSVEHHLTGILQSFVNKTSGSDSVLHKLIKRSDGGLRLSLKDIGWSVFWMTFGFPIILAFWIMGSLMKRPGTFVMVARPVIKKKIA